MKFESVPGATPLDPDEAADLLVTTISTQGELNELEEANILAAQNWALDRKHADLLSEAFLKELHRRMFDTVWRWAGTYRRSNKNIGVDWPEIPIELRKFFGDVRFWLDDASMPRDELGARAHHRLVFIHAFANGNGRHARLFTDVLMKSQSKPLFSWGAGANLTEAGDVRGRYIAALRAADQGNYAPLIAFVRS